MEEVCWHMQKCQLHCDRFLAPNSGFFLVDKFILCYLLFVTFAKHENH